MRSSVAGWVENRRAIDAALRPPCRPPGRDRWASASGLWMYACAIAEPWPPEARAWVVQAMPQLTRPEILQRLWDAISAVPVDERSPEEQDCLDQIAHQLSTLRFRDVAGWSFEDD